VQLQTLADEGDMSATSPRMPLEGGFERLTQPLTQEAEGMVEASKAFWVHVIFHT
jgi:hypothetical protein